MVTAEQLNLLCQRLQIGLRVFTPDSIAKASADPKLMAITKGMQNIPDPSLHFRWFMTVRNASAHWEYEEPNHDLKAVAAHNEQCKSMTLSNENVLWLKYNHEKTALEAPQKPTPGSRL